MEKKKIIIIGGGPANLMAADVLAASHEVHLYEKGKAVGRKFLVAGNGGFNLCHHAGGADLRRHYSGQALLAAALDSFDSVALREWLAGIGIPTFVGSSGRVFPEEGIKPIHVLQKIRNRLVEKRVGFHFFHEFVSFSKNGNPVFLNKGGEVEIEGDYYIFGLGGASWSKTGSDGKWAEGFEAFGVRIIPFQSSNCGVNIPWDDGFRERYNGFPLKNIRLSAGDFSIRGEALVTLYGLEGNAVYPCIPYVRALLSDSLARACVFIDLKPNNTREQLLAKIRGKRVRTKNYAYLFNLDRMQLALIKSHTDKATFLNPVSFIDAIKNLCIPVRSLRGLEEAISTVGGVDLNELNDDFSLKGQPDIFVVGEMLDWDAPTGGFLLQACFSMGYAAAVAIGGKH